MKDAALRRRQLSEQLWERVRNEGCLETAASFLTHPNADHRFAAVWCLGRGALGLKDGLRIASSYVQQLRAMFEIEPDVGVKNEIVFALPMMGYADMAYRFVDLANADPRLSLSFLPAVQAYFRVFSGTDLVAGGKQRLSQPFFDNKRILYIFWLGQTAMDQEAIDVLRVYEADTNERVRTEADAAIRRIEERASSEMGAEGRRSSQGQG